MELEGKVAVVTGGANGIGRASAELFVAQGARVIIADVNDEAGESLAATLGDAAVFRHTDVGDADAVAAVVEAAQSRFGRLDVMFNNAAISGTAFSSFLDDPLEEFDRIMHINLRGVMLGTRDAARVMKEQGGGVILNTASIAGTLAGFGLMTYRAAKAAVVHFSKSAAIDLARHGIRVHCIVPGHVRTGLSSFQEPGVSKAVADKITRGVDAAYLANQLIKRRGEPVDVANLALFLASDKSRHMTGTVMPVEGGVTVGDPVNHLEEILEVRRSALA